MTKIQRNTAFQAYLGNLGACADAREWAGERTARQAWDECERADWLLWWAAKAIDRKLLVRAACLCARRALPYVKTGDLRPLRVIEAAERWREGSATIAEIRVARGAAAYAAADAADATDAAAYAADAAAYAAANAAHAAAHAAVYAATAVYATTAADTSDAAAYAAAAAADAAAYAAAAYAAADATAYAGNKSEELRAMCSLVRELVTFPGEPQQ